LRFTKTIEELSENVNFNKINDMYIILKIRILKNFKRKFKICKIKNIKELINKVKKSSFIF